MISFKLPAQTQNNLPLIPYRLSLKPYHLNLTTHSMRTKVTLLLLFLNVALFAYIYYQRAEGKHPEQNLVLGPETANIQSLEIASGNSAGTITIERSGDNWMLAKPLQWPANEFAVTRIINELQQLHPYATFTVAELAQTGQTLADYGLEKPSLSLTLTPAPAAPGLPAPAPTTLKIGDPTKVGNRLYVLSPDEKSVHVVNRSLAESLALRLEDLRADTLFTIPVFEVRAFRIQPPAPATAIRISNDNNRWLFDSPFKTNNVRANKTATVLAINELHKLKAKTFLDPQQADAVRTGLASPQLQISLNGNGRHEALLVGSPVPPAEAGPAAPAPTGAAGNLPPSPSVEYYAQMDDKTPVFTVVIPTELLEKLRDAQEKLRDPHVLDLELSTVTTLTLSAPNLPDVTLQRLESSTPNPATALWQVVRHNGEKGQQALTADREKGPQTLPADRELVERLLQKLNQLTAERFVDDAPSLSALEEFGFNRPTREISISNAKAPAGAAVRLQIGATSGAEPSVYAKLAGQPYVYRVSNEILQDSPVSLLAYRDRLVRELPTGAQITGLKLTDLATQAVLLDTALPMPVQTASDKTTGPHITHESVEALALQLRALRARSFLRDEFANTVAIGGEERPWHYRLDTTLSLVGSGATQANVSTLYFSERTGGTTQYVGSPDLALIFEAEQPLLDSFFAVAYGTKDPGPASPPPAEPATGSPAPVATPTKAPPPP